MQPESSMVLSPSLFYLEKDNLPFDVLTFKGRVSYSWYMSTHFTLLLINR